MPHINRSYDGKLNLDTHPYRVGPSDAIDALNVTRDAIADGTDIVTSTLAGNILVPYTQYTTGGAINKIIGKYADKVRNRNYAFKWNSAGRHSITYYDANVNAVYKVIENITDTNGIDILGFNPSFKINHVDIIYIDTGDLLFWTDGLNPPSKIDITLAISGGYGAYIERSFIDVSKEIPPIPPSVVYENDATVTVNNFRKKLTKVKYRWVFDNKEKSAWSAHSELPLPIGTIVLAGTLNPTIDADPTKNCVIAIVYRTGKSNVKKIEIAAAQNIGNGYSPFYLIQVIDKLALGLSNNDINVYRFYNNQAYTYVDQKESTLPFDFVPLKAYTQVLPNGNVLDYGAITEGYDLTTITATTGIGTLVQQATELPFNLTASQSGDSGFGTGNIHIIITGVFTFYSYLTNIFNIYTTNQSISYIAAVGNTNANIIAGLSASAVTAGFTVVSSNSENLVIVKTGEALLRTYIANNFLTNLDALNRFSDSFAYDWNSRYSFGVIYFDEKGRTNSVVTNTSIPIQTPGFTLLSVTIPSIPRIIFSIYSSPPLWAKYYEIVRTKNLTKSKTVYWISDRTFKDLEFAYISIENLNGYIKVNPSSNFLKYNFSSGDRVRFIRCLSNATNDVYASNDYEIQSEVFNPTVNGVDLDGQFMKIRLPTTTSTFDFNTTQFNNYLVNLYTPAQSVANGLDIYYEFGERYAIGNPGTATAFHQGMFQNQSTDYVTPATFEFTKGDNYYRTRTIVAGNIISYKLQNNDVGIKSFVIAATLDSVSFTDPQYTVNPTIAHLNGFVGNLFVASSQSIRMVSGSKTFQFKGQIVVVPANDCIIEVGLAVVVGTGPTVVYNMVAASSITTIPAGTQYTLNPNLVFTASAGQNVVVYIINTGSQSVSINVISGNYKFFDPSNIKSTPLIDANYSDFFPSAVNSNGREWVVNQNALQTFYPTKVRFSGDYLRNTQLNRINRFYDENQDNYDNSNGSIKKMFIEGHRKYVFQQFDTGVVPILTQIVRDVTGNPLEANSDVLLNKITYPFKGKYGIGDVPESFAYGKGNMYGADSNKGVIWRIAHDGMLPISIIYECNNFFITKLQNFKSALNNGLSVPGQFFKGNPTVYGEFDDYTNKYIIAIEEINRYSIGTGLEYAYFTSSVNGGVEFNNNSSIVGTSVTLVISAVNGDSLRVTYTTILGDTGTSIRDRLITLVNAALPSLFSASIFNLGTFPGKPTIPFYYPGILISNIASSVTTASIILTGPLIFHQNPYTISFNESRDRKTEGFESQYSYYPEMMSCINNLFVSYLSGAVWTHNSNTKCNFYGVQYDASVTLVFNEHSLEKKTWISITELANTIWDCPEISTQLMSYGTTVQQSVLKSSQFSRLEGEYHAAFRKDSNSRGGMINGSSLKGNYIIIKFRTSATNYVFISAISINYIDSPLTTR